MIVIDIILLLISLALAVVGIIVVFNTLTLPRLGAGLDGGELSAQATQASAAPKPAALISILIPMPSPAEELSSTLPGLLAQDDPAYEVLVLVDGPDCASAAVARQAALGMPNLKVLNSNPLPEGWQNKNWACAQLAQAAQGDTLVFVEAGVHWAPQALSRLRRALEYTHADVYSLWPTQVTETWSERLVLPMVSLAVMGNLQALTVHSLPWASLYAANGLVLAFKRAAYLAVNGHTEIKNQAATHSALEKLVKLQGLKLRKADAAGLLTCRSYRDWPTLRDGLARNILSGHCGIGCLLSSTLFHWLMFLFPWAWFLLGWLGGMNFRYPIWALTLVATGLAIRALTAKATRQRVGDAVFLPVSVILMTLITGLVLRWRWAGDYAPAPSAR